MFVLVGVVFHVEESLPARLSGAQRGRVKVVDLTKELFRLGGELLGAGRTADVNDLPVDECPFRTLGQLALHHGTNPLCPSKVGVDRCPVLRVDLAFQATLATKKNRLLADVDFDRPAVGA